MVRRVLLLLAHVAAAAAVGQTQTGRLAANPIRKVVTMLQMMQKKVDEEGEKSQELYDKFMCYCKTSGSTLAEGIEAAEAKVPELTASIEAGEGKLAQLKDDVASHTSDRKAAKTAMAEATAIREKEKAAFDKAFGESKVNLAALRKAVAALEKGMAGSFLQTGDAGLVRAVVAQSKDMLDADRAEVLSFLSGRQGDAYAPASGEITGLLKQLGDEMDKDQQDMVATEGAAVKDHEGLTTAKKKEVAALSKAIEDKMGRTAELGVEIAGMKNDVGDTAEALEEDKAFLADLEKNCDSKTGIHEEEKKMRAQEVVALADTIKVLNDDDALDLFKKTLPSAGASFVQVQVTSSAMRAQARALLAEARSRVQPGQGRQRLDFIALALSGRKVGFEKVMTLIDELVATLKKEQTDDDDKKEYCAKEFDEADDKKKGLERTISDLETVIEEAKEGIATLTEEIKALEAGIKALDKSVAEATEQRKEENAAYKELMASDGAAKEVIGFAKNRLNKFYNPKMYKAPPKRELSAEDRIFVNQGGTPPPTEAPGGIAGTGIEAFVQLASRTQHKVAPPPPPETAAAYTKKSEESGGVLAMMDLLVKDLDKEMTIAEAEEKNAQEDYEKMTADAAEKRTEDSKLLTDKAAAKADLESSLETSTSEKKATTKELMATDLYISNLHAECDWLVQYHEVRKEARTDEIDSLEKAKAVLSGADYSLLQRGSSAARARKFLRRA